jgi:3-oxoacyl-[acyl-carrier-protein] synthase-3
VQTKIGAVNAACLDVSAACAGFLFALEIAQQFVTSHAHDTVLVIGAEKLSSITNWTDRNTCVLFGDGAGAAILQHRGSAHGIISTHVASNGNYSDILWMPGGGCRTPITAENAHQWLQTIHMSGKDVYKQAVTSMMDASYKALGESRAHRRGHRLRHPAPGEHPDHRSDRRSDEDPDRAVLHQCRSLWQHLRRGGGDRARRGEPQRSLKRGDYILMVVFGGGLTWSSTVIEW